jgi:lysozyme
MSRKPIFDAARAAGADFNRPGNIGILDSALDALGVPPDGDMHVSQVGINLIKVAEGLDLKAYQDTGGVWTIGVGHTGPDVHAGLVITEARADELLRRDLTTAEDAVRRLFPTTTQNQFDALVSFTFNLGEGQVAGSTLRRKHNAGDYDGARAEFGRWNKDNGKVLNGLTKRRAAEAKLYGGVA